MESRLNLSTSMDEMSETEEEPPPAPPPRVRSRVAAHLFPRLPVQLTWKGVEIYFPSVVLTPDLKERADEALKLRIQRESNADCAPSESESEKESEEVPSTSSVSDVHGLQRNRLPSEPMPHASKSKGTAKESGQKHQCKVCGREFATNYLIRRHMKLHSKGKGKSKRNYGPCERCGARFHSTSGLKKHINSCVVGESSSALEAPVVIKTEKTDEDVEMNDDISADHSDETSCDAIATENENVVPESITQNAWGDIFLKNYEEKQKQLTLDAEALKAKMQEKRVANLQSELNTSSQSSIKSKADNSSDDGGAPILSPPASAYSGEELFKCQECSSIFTSSKEYRLHSSMCSQMSKPTTADGRLREHHCIFCPWKFTNAYGLQRHMNIHTGERFSCSKCQATFGKQSYLDLHFPRCGEDKETRPFKCEACPREFVQKRYLDQHRKVHMRDNSPSQGHHQTPRTPFSCEICNKTFSSSKSLKVHNLTHMGDSTLVISNVSGSATLPSENLKANTKLGGIRFKCKLCKKKFTTNFSLQRHSSSCSVGLKSTGTKTKSSSTLSQDLLTDRNNRNLTTETDLSEGSQSNDVVSSNSFKCDACGNCFNDKLSLSRHCLSHVMDGFPDQMDSQPSTSGIVTPKPSTSKISNLTSEARKSLDSSEIGAGLIYTCKYKNCTHFFSHDEDLWYHIEKKHKSFDHLCCNKCGQDFDSEPSMSHHMKSAHGSQEQEMDQKKDSDVIKLEAPDITYEDDYSQDDYQESPDDYNDEDYTNSIPATTELEKLKTEILRQNKTDPFILISSECRAAAEVALNSFVSNDYDESESDERRGENFRLDIPIQDYYKCEDCPSSTIFNNRLRYIAHLNYHAFIKKRGIKFSEKSGVRRQEKGLGFEETVPVQDLYTCERCPVPREFTLRKAYINHLNYHESMRKQGREWVIGSNSNKPRDDIPFKNVYTCESETCKGRIFRDRTSYIGHVHYHERMKAKGREWAIGTGKQKKSKRKGGAGRPRGHLFRDDIPIQDVYTCESETCNGKIFPDRISYIAHVNYHKKMKEMGREWTIGKRINKSKTLLGEDIPVMDVYTCESKTCHSRTFRDRAAYILHLHYHKVMIAKGREWAIGLRRGPKLRYENIAVQDVYICEECEEPTEFTDRDSYISHLQFHERSRQRIINQGSRKKRPKTRTRFDEIPYQDEYTCETCDGRTFPNRASYINHLTYHRTLERQGNDRTIRIRGGAGDRNFRRRTDIPHQDMYTCKYCGQIYPERAKYITHLYYHEVLGPKAAEVREEKQNLKRDMLRLSDIPVQNVYRCKYCTEIKTFTDRAKYHQHLCYHKAKKKFNELAVEHAAVDDREDIPYQDSYVCQVCGEEKIFTQRSAYLKHLKYHKTMRDKTYKCSVCEKAFSSAWNLSSHAKTHTSEKAFTCGDCGKRFRVKDGLKKHQYLCKKVPCKYTCHCGDKFHSIQFLEIHVSRYHKPGASQPAMKKFRCYVCNQEFIQAFELNQHVKKFHPLDYMEFMQQKAVSEATAAFAEAYREENIEHEDEDHDVSSLIPEIVMKTEDMEMETEEANVMPLSLEPVIDEPNLINLPPSDAPSWTFIPELEDMENCNAEEDEYYPEFLPESFEPEDVELQGCTSTSLLENQLRLAGTSVEYRVPAEANSLQAVTKPKADHRFKCGYCDKMCSKVQFLKLHHHSMHKTLKFKCVDLSKSNNISSHEPSTSTYGQTVVDWSTQQTSEDGKILDSSLHDTSCEYKCFNCNRTYSSKFCLRRHALICIGDKAILATSTDRWKCGHCDKTSEKEPNLKRHHYVMHRNLDYKFIDLSLSDFANNSGSTRVSESLEAPAPIVSSTSSRSSFSEQNSLSSTPPLRRPSNDESTTVRSEKSTRGGPKSRLKCTCCVSDTALGYLKRCVGGVCPCYSNTKGCAEGCFCKGRCNNPYFRNSKPPVVRSLPDLVPVSVVPLYDQDQNSRGLTDSISNSTSTSSKPSSQYELRIMETATTVNSSMSELEKMYWDTISDTTSAPKAPVSISPFTATYNSLAEALHSGSQDSSASSSRLIPDLQPLKEVEIPVEDPQNADVSKGLKCRYCTEEFINLSSYVSHQWSHNNENEFVCPLCQKTFKVVSHLVLHSRIHFQDFPCSECSEVFKLENELKWHCMLNHSSNSKECSVCKAQFPTKAAVTEHQMKDHSVCDICQQAFSKDFYLKRHRYISHGIRYNNIENGESSSSSNVQVQGARDTSSGIQLIDLLEEEDVTEYRPSSPPMPVIVGSSSIVTPPEPDYSYIDINLILD